MQLLSSIAELKNIQSPIHWAMGFFDGFHLGHQQLLRTAKQAGLTGMLSFATHPMQLLCPERAPKLLCPDLAQRIALAEAAGVDILLLLPFSEELSQIYPRDFLDAIAEACPIGSISVGENWQFGRGGMGDAAYLRGYAQEKGFAYFIHELCELEGIGVVSSSRVRERLAAADLAAVRAMLGRDFCIEAEVEHGQQLARQWGYPTANMRLSEQAALPPFGVYAISAVIDGQRVHGVANLGLRPSINEACKIVRLECHFFDWSGDLYGQRLSVELRHFLRAERHFAGLDELRAQIERDALDARAL